MQAQAIQYLPAQITRFGRVQPGKYPPYERVQSVLFTCQTSQGEKTHWKTFPADEARLLKVGQPAYLYNIAGLGERAKWDVTFNNASPAGTQPAPGTSRPLVPIPVAALAQAPALSLVPVPQAVTATAPDISTWINESAQLYAQCFDAAARTLAPREVSEETVRAAASTLYISASRKFNLER